MTVANSAGKVVSAGGVLALMSAPPALTVSVDFNADGQSDILLQSDVAGKRSIWLMAGATIGSALSLGTLALDWELAGAGDFNRDGKSDLIWQNSRPENAPSG